MESPTDIILEDQKLSFDRFREEVLRDYRLCCESREASLLGRKEVLTGKAKFGIFGDGKEVAQVAVAKFFQPGDFLSGYYRDQTLAFATGQATVEEFFAQLYADPDTAHEPHSGGRQMNSHFCTPVVDSNGNWVDLANQKNITAGLAPTAGQMPRSIRTCSCIKAIQELPRLADYKHLSNNGNEVCFCTIGDASTSEGHFWETINAAGVLQIPLAVFVWDDGYGISVPTKYQTTKGSVSEALKGFQKREGTNGIEIFRVKAWDYAGMCETFEQAIRLIRETHTPVLFHVEEVTQPQGHSTSGSHERYKPAERLEWEREWDANRKMREWVISNALASEDEILEIERNARDHVRSSRQQAWDNYIQPIKSEVDHFMQLVSPIAESVHDPVIQKAIHELRTNREPQRKDILKAMHTILLVTGDSMQAAELKEHYQQEKSRGYQDYGSFLYDESEKSPLKIAGSDAEYNDESPSLNGYEILNKYFDALFSTNKKVIAFGEDVGQIGDVNQGFAGLQARHGDMRVFDTGIRELTIVGQAIGLSMRGLCPIAEIQYLDYVLYGLQTLSDDAATLHWRTKGRQSCPLIIRTRGHRLEGIWHSGSPMAMMIHALRGFHICVPRNMVQALGMYNTLLAGNDPAIMVESLNGYRLKEKLPSNLISYQVPLGIPEIIREGEDITIVSYGSMLRIIQDAATVAQSLGINCEIIDVQTLLPFDRNHAILESLKKTNRILFIDEDVPGGGAAYMYNKVMEEQDGYKWLDVAPRTISGKAHRPSYGSDGDYFSKPNAEEIIDAIIEMVKE